MCWVYNDNGDDMGECVMKMKDLFPEAFEVEHNKSFGVQNCHWVTFGTDYHSNCEQDDAIEIAVLNHDNLVEQLTNSQHCINAIGIIMTNSDYTPKEKVQKIKGLMGIHVNETFAKNRELLSQLKGNEQ